MAELPFRQVHLDFHTSPLIPDVASDFNATEFATTLKGAHVNSVTVFARCHHGMCYYPSKVAKVHPALRRDLLGEMIGACHAQGIRTPVYITVVWDEHVAHEHPEWLQVSANGYAGTHPPFTAAWKWLCPNSPYLDYVAAQAEEVARDYDADGFFFDIMMMTEPGCLCRYCLDGMLAKGLDPRNETDLRQYSLEVAKRAMARLTEVVRRYKPEASIFYNSRLRPALDADSGLRDELQYGSHLEIESLPSDPHWGYLHYPLLARYVQTLGTDFLGMTARFHKSWADFGGLKNEAALEYETFSMLASGGKCSIGDQLHPRGVLEQVAYERIGRIYAEVEALEPWCRGAIPVKEVGVLLTVDGLSRRRDLTAEEGATRMLLESQRQFQLIDELTGLAEFQLVILPDCVPVSDKVAARLREYVTGGGSLLISGASGLREEGFVLEELMGLSYAGRPGYTTHYLQPDPSLGLPDMLHVMYEQPLLVRPAAGAQVLARITEPYFERTWDHFSSHFQTAPDRASEWPAIVQRGRVIYLAAPIFSAYRRHGNLVYRQTVEACLDRLAPGQAVRAALPSSGQVTLLRQGDNLVAHLLYYPAERRTPEIDIIEDVVSLYDVRLWVRAGGIPKHVYLAPQGRPLNRSITGEHNAGIISVVVPELRGHQMVVLEM